MNNPRTTGQGMLEIEVNNTGFILHPYRAVFWPEKSTVIVTDLHLGKIQHFRNAGIYVPSHASFDNYERLSSLLLDFSPRSILILGDLFHSHYNQDWKNFCELRNSFADIEFSLIPGNHDIVNPGLFEENNVICYGQNHQLGAFCFSHYPREDSSALYNIAGHIHPGIRLVGDGLQSLRLPSFYFGRHRGLLPSFGTFTGISLIQPEPGDQVVAITDDGLVRLDTL
ncbi:MAG: ligase-associated DNA damage response endonuclease PdeM [Saprospiraceae bacterium]|nr:ligase-associated DNA damage response endonuclease PdeM [Saprospiraceae bacterium]